MPITPTTQSYSHTFGDQLDNILAQYNDLMGSDVQPYTIDNRTYNFLYLANLIYEAISADLVANNYDPLAPLSPYDLGNGEAFLLSSIVREVNVSLSNAPSPVGLIFLPTGAVETVDGDFQRFTYDGEYSIPVSGEISYSHWKADVAVEARQPEYQIEVKMPDLTGGKTLNLIVCDGEFDDATFLSLDMNHVAIELRENEGSTVLIVNDSVNPANSTSNGLTQPTIGSTVTLVLTADEVVVTSGGVPASSLLPLDFFTANPNVILYSGSVTTPSIPDAITTPASAKISGLGQA